jgi:hypothetical protein
VGDARGLQRAYVAFRARLKRDGVEPEDETRDLYRRLRGAVGPPPLGPAPDEAAPDAGAASGG